MQNLRGQGHFERWKACWLGLTLLSAAFVCFLRSFTQTDLGYDLTIQIQAGQRLLAGQGLTTYAMGSGFLTDKTAATLTHFPSGFSLYTAFLLKLGVSLSWVIKIQGVFLTILGWWGWGRFLVACIGSPQNQGWLRTVPGCLLAVFLPLYATPTWSGTDLFLWASLPWVINLLAFAERAQEKQRFFLYGLGGVLCGLCTMMRYASFSLTFATGLIIYLQTRSSWRKAMGGILAFGFSFFLTVSPQIWILLNAEGEQVTPGGITGIKGWETIPAKIWVALSLLPAWNSILTFWLPERIAKVVEGRAGWSLMANFLVLSLSVLPLLVFKKVYGKNKNTILSDPRILGSLMILVIPAFLVLCTFVGSYTYVGDRRYYATLIPLGICLVTFLASPNGSSDTRSLNKITSFCSRMYILFYLLISSGSVLFLFLEGAHGDVIRKKVFRNQVSGTFLKSGLFYEESLMKKNVKEILQREPDIQLLTNYEEKFWADSSLNQARIHRIESCQNLAGIRVKGPAKILIVAVDRGNGKIYAIRSDSSGTLVDAPCIENLGPMERIGTFSERGFLMEKIKVLRVEIPDGHTASF